MYKVLIIGCGNIAGSLDKISFNTLNRPLTHAKAYKLDDNFQVVACVEPNQSLRKEFKKIWNIEKDFSNLSDVIDEKVDIDIVSICTPTEHHFSTLKQVLELNPKLVFCEKPLCNSSEEAKIILRKYAKKNVQLVINFSRRFDESFTNLKNEINSNKYGQLKAISGFYNKGFINNGSHLIDILGFLLESIEVEWVGAPLFDFYPNDPSYPVALTAKNAVVISLLPADAKDFSLFELDFIFSNKRIRMLNGGMTWSFQDVCDDKNFLGYKSLTKPKILDGGYKDAFSNALKSINNILKGSQKNIFTEEEILKTIRLCDKILKKN